MEYGGTFNISLAMSSCKLLPLLSPVAGAPAGACRGWAEWTQWTSGEAAVVHHGHGRES